MYINKISSQPSDRFSLLWISLHYVTLEETYTVSHGVKWWKESPEEFAAGFTEETQVYHNEGPVINQNSNEALAALYGPAAAHAEYSRFTTVKYRDSGREKQGMIMWITEATPDCPMLYVIEAPGFPDFVPQGDILGVVQ